MVLHCVQPPKEYISISLCVRTWLRPDSSMYTEVESYSVTVFIPAYLPGTACSCATVVVAKNPTIESNATTFFIYMVLYILVQRYEKNAK